MKHVDMIELRGTNAETIFPLKVSDLLGTFYVITLAVTNAGAVIG